MEANSALSPQPDIALERPGGGAMFTRIARRYDAVNRVLSLGLDKRWRRRAAAALGLETVRDAHIVDVACGTGDLSFEILRQLPTARVTGVDPSTGMLEVMAKKGRSRRRAGAADRLRIERGGAEDLSQFDDGSVAGVTIAFGLRNVADRPTSISEMLRVLAPGRRLVVLEFTEPRGGGLARLARFHIHHVVPRLGALLSGKREYRYLQSSIEEFPSAPSLAAELREAGADRVWVEPMCMGAVHLIVASRGTTAS